SGRLCSDTGLDGAIRWFVSPPSHTELQLLGAATILEHLVDKYQRSNGKLRILERPQFRVLRRQLHLAFDEALKKLGKSEALVALFKRLWSKVGYLNSPSLRESTDILMDYHMVPLGDLRDRVSQAIRARNAVVHDFDYYEQLTFEEMYGHVAVLREALKLLFMTLLGYVGQYHSMLNGSEWKQFPPPDGL